MSDIRNYDSTVYTPLLVEDLNSLVDFTFNAKLPEISASTNSIVDIVLSSIDASKLTSDSALVTEVVNRYNALKQDDTCSAIFEDLNVAANAFASKLRESYKELSDVVYPEMQSLKSAINETTEKLLRRDGMEALVAPNSDITPQFKTINWDEMINMQGGIEALEEVFDSVNNFKGGFTINSVRSALNSGKYDIESLQLGSEALRDMKMRFNESLTATKQYDELDVERFIGILTSKYEFRKLTDTLRHLIDSNNVVADINTTCGMLSKLSGMVPVAKATPLNVSSRIRDEIDHNLKVLSNTISLAAYELQATRILYENSLIIGKHTLNGDNVLNFTREGGRLEDIAHFLQFRDDVPFGGISGQEVLDNREKINQLLKDQNTEHFKNADRIKADYQTKAAKLVFEDYIKRTPKKDIPEGLNLNEFMDQCLPIINSEIKRLNSDGDNNIESMINNVIFKVHYHDSIVRRIHAMLGEAFVNHSHASEKLTDEDLNMMDVDTGCRIAGEFIATRLI